MSLSSHGTCHGLPAHFLGRRQNHITLLLLRKYHNNSIHLICKTTMHKKKIYLLFVSAQIFKNMRRHNENIARSHSPFISTASLESSTKAYIHTNSLISFSYTQAVLHKNIYSEISIPPSFAYAFTQI